VSENEPSAEQARRSVTVLFIVGDRGGSQLNQIQTPNEYHAIQDALLGSKHRDAIALCSPIMAATRDRLAMAYRQRPDVIHFAGHGNDRALAIIEDLGQLASTVPLDASEFGRILQNMQSPILLCVLNACYSANLANALAAGGEVQNAIGWEGRVSDSVAIAFSRALYGALGDGRTVPDAVAVAAAASGAGDAPKLVTGPSATAESLVGEDDQ
jgi:hypothetical protein